MNIEDAGTKHLRCVSFLGTLFLTRVGEPLQQDDAEYDEKLKWKNVAIPRANPRIMHSTPSLCRLCQSPLMFRNSLQLMCLIRSLKATGRSEIVREGFIFVTAGFRDS